MSSAGFPSTILEQVPKLNGDNWHTWQSNMLMVFQFNKSDEIISGVEKEPAVDKVSELKDWKRKNKLAVPIMWSRIEPEWQHLLLRCTLGSVTFAALKTKFEESNYSRQVALRKVFYGAVHDPSKHIDIFIQDVLRARDQLKAIGVDVDDTAVKDVILMNLDESYKDVKTSLLTQPTEPSLATVRSILGNSQLIVNPDSVTTVKTEDTALATRFRRRSSEKGTGRSFASTHSRNKENSDGVDDKKGFRWCDPTHDNHCHRCGRTGHIAAACYAEMPPEIKSWIQNRPGKEKSMYVSNASSWRSRSPHHRSSPQPYSAFRTKSQS